MNYASHRVDRKIEVTASSKLTYHVIQSVLFTFMRIWNMTEPIFGTGPNVVEMIGLMLLKIRPPSSRRICHSRLVPSRSGA